MRRLGPEFVSESLDTWAYRNGIQFEFSGPGKPADNAFAESFNGRFRDECLDQHWFASLPVLPLLMERGAVTRPGRGRPRVRPDRVAGDKAYSSPTIRRYLKGRGIGSVIPTKADEAPDPSFDQAAYRERNVVERTINRLKQWRRVATRYEKRAANYLAVVTVAAILLWL